MKRAMPLGSGLLLAIACQAHAGEADVVDANVSAQGENKYRFEVTVRHADAGWEHYADAWEVVGPDGEVLAVRELLHPHDNEQPFTRSLDDVAVPPAVERVTVRARDKVHGYGGREAIVQIPAQP